MIFLLSAPQNTALLPFVTIRTSLWYDFVRFESCALTVLLLGSPQKATNENVGPQKEGVIVTFISLYKESISSAVPYRLGMNICDGS